MTGTAFFLILVSVFLHATWNFISKKANPCGSYYMISSATASLMWMGFFVSSGIPYASLPARFWIFYAVSTAGEILYALGLAYGYRHSEISLIYPVGRSLPVVGVALCSLVFGLGKDPSWIALAGMLVITIGALLLPQKDLKNLSLKNYWNRNLLYIIMITVGTTLYTIMDSEATKILKQYKEVSPVMRGLSYIFLVEFGIVIGLGIRLIFDKKDQQEMKHLLRSPYPYLTGLCSSSAYLLVLLAMPLVTNVSFIQAFRQLSLPLGVFAGAVFLKEEMYPLKVTGVLLIMIGLLMTVL